MKMDSFFLDDETLAEWGTSREHPMQIHLEVHPSYLDGMKPNILVKQVIF